MKSKGGKTDNCSSFSALGRWAGSSGWHQVPVSGTSVNGGVAKEERVWSTDNWLWTPDLWHPSGIVKAAVSRPRLGHRLGEVVADTEKGAVDSSERVWGEKRKKQSPRVRPKNTSLSFTWTWKKRRKLGRVCCIEVKGGELRREW